MITDCPLTLAAASAASAAADATAVATADAADAAFADWATPFPAAFVCAFSIQRQRMP